MFSVKLATGDQRRGHRMMLEVCAEEDAVLCYSHRCRVDSAFVEPALRLRIPLLAATAGLVGGCRRSIVLATADCESNEVVRGLSSQQEGCSQQLAEGAFRLRCASDGDAQILLLRLQKAGCVLEGLTQRYRFVRRVGRGSFGDVLEAVDLLTNNVVAVKIFSRTAPKHLHPLREATLLRRSAHPAFVRFEGLFLVTEPDLLRQCGAEGDSTWAIVTELLSGKELFEVLSESGPLHEQTARGLSRQLFEGLARLHARGIVHRDIKSENVMALADGTFRLVDFGLAAPSSDPEASASISGSPGHIAPELLRREPLTDKADSFGMGVLLFCALCGRRPFQGSDRSDVLRKNFKCQYDAGLLAHLSPEAADLIARLLGKDPKKRPSAAECLEHPWLAGGGEAAPPGRSPPEEASCSLSAEVAATSIGSQEAVMNSAASSDDRSGSISCGFGSEDSKVTSRSSSSCSGSRSSRAARAVGAGLSALRKLRSLNTPLARPRKRDAGFARVVPAA